MQKHEQVESNIEVVSILFSNPPPVRIAPIDEDIAELELQDPERWDGLS
jgi:hypothetical protein